MGYDTAYACRPAGRNVDSVPHGSSSLALILLHRLLESEARSDGSESVVSAVDAETRVPHFVYGVPGCRGDLVIEVLRDRCSLSFELLVDLGLKPRRSVIGLACFLKLSRISTAIGGSLHVNGRRDHAVLSNFALLHGAGRP